MAWERSFIKGYCFLGLAELGLPRQHVLTQASTI
jgi:hypothetical protein